MSQAAGVTARAPHEDRAPQRDGFRLSNASRANARGSCLIERRDARRVEARLALLAKQQLASVRGPGARLRAQGSGALHAQTVEAMTANASPFLPLVGRSAEILSTRVMPQ